MRVIKFRQAIYKNKVFDRWHYWGFVGYRDTFIGPITINGIGNIWECKQSQEYLGWENKYKQELWEGDILSSEVRAYKGLRCTIIFDSTRNGWGFDSGVDISHAYHWKVISNIHED